VVAVRQNAEVSELYPEFKSGVMAIFGKRCTEGVLEPRIDMYGKQFVIDGYARMTFI
jgi:hypothetical protein